MGNKMWILVITILAIVDSRELTSSIATHDFESENSCKTARDIYLNDLKPILDDLNKGMVERGRVGQVQQPSEIFSKAVCVKR